MSVPSDEAGGWESFYGRWRGLAGCMCRDWLWQNPGVAERQDCEQQAAVALLGVYRGVGDAAPKPQVREAINAGLHELRPPCRGEMVPPDGLADPHAADPAAEVAANEGVDIILQALAGLAAAMPRHHALLQGSMEGRTQGELARIHLLPVNLVAAMLVQARKWVRRKLDHPAEPRRTRAA